MNEKLCIHPLEYLYLYFVCVVAALGLSIRGCVIKLTEISVKLWSYDPT